MIEIELARPLESAIPGGWLRIETEAGFRFYLGCGHFDTQNGVKHPEWNQEHYKCQ